jgi:hypothetical protein
MARFIGDQNSVGFLYESGTYAAESGGRHSVGLVQEFNVGENINNIDIRYQGAGDRNVDQFANGALDYELSYNYLPQDWKILGFALGSCVDAGSPSPYTHTLSETNSASGNAFTSGANNPFISMTLEHAQKGAATGENYIRTIRGTMVNNMTISMSQGEPISIDVEAVGQSGTFTSGAISLPTIATTRPFMWDDVQIEIPSGTGFNNITEAEISIDNSMEVQHYLNGSRVADIPVPLNREYEVSLTMVGNSETTQNLYETKYLPGSEFNMMFAIGAAEAGTGSRDAFMVFSGCKITEMESPGNQEGINEQSITIKPKTMNTMFIFIYEGGLEK